MSAASKPGDRQLAAATRAVLAERFPACFAAKGSDKKPLKLGIDLDLFEAAPDLPRRAIRLALRDYTFGPRYAACLVAGAERVDLGGGAAGAVTGSEAEGAAWRVAAVNRNDALRRQSERLDRIERDIAKIAEFHRQEARATGSVLDAHEALFKVTREALVGLAAALETALRALAATKEVDAAIDYIKKAFGAPGEFGYGTREGDALYRLYQARAALLTSGVP